MMLCNEMRITQSQMPWQPSCARRARSAGGPRGVRVYPFARCARGVQCVRVARLCRRCMWPAEVCGVASAARTWTCPSEAWHMGDACAHLAVTARHQPRPHSTALAAPCGGMGAPYDPHRGVWRCLQPLQRPWSHSPRGACSWRATLSLPPCHPCEPFYSLDPLGRPGPMAGPGMAPVRRLVCPRLAPD